MHNIFTCCMHIILSAFVMIVCVMQCAWFAHAIRSIDGCDSYTWLWFWVYLPASVWYYSDFAYMDVVFVMMGVLLSWAHRWYVGCCWIVVMVEVVVEMGRTPHIFETQLRWGGPHIYLRYSWDWGGPHILVPWLDGCLWLSHACGLWLSCCVVWVIFMMFPCWLSRAVLIACILSYLCYDYFTC